MTRAPDWMSKHPCTACGTGYGICGEGALHSLMCCKDCQHPTRWADNPWTSADVLEMWEGKEMPQMVKDGLQQILARENPRTEPAVPSPLEWHPAYADKTHLLDWLNEVGPYAKMWDIKLAIAPRFNFASFASYTETEQPAITAPSFKTIVLHRQKCWGPAPYVGKPFVYMWNAAVDELGRGIAGESRIEYLPEWMP